MSDSSLPAKTNGDPLQQGISGSIQIDSIDDLSRIANMMAKSGFFDDAKSAHQAGVKIMAGMELGIPPVASVRGIDIIDGNTSLSSALLAALIKQHPRYDYQVLEVTDERCEIAFFDRSERQGTASFSMEEAESVVAWEDKNGEHYLAEKDNWQNYPSDCLFARTISRGRRRFCPDVGLGKLYTAEELSPNGEPQVVEAEVVEESSGKTNGDRQEKTGPSPNGTQSESTEPQTRQNGGAEKGTDSDGGNDYDDLPFDSPKEPPAEDVNRFHALGTELYGDDWDEKRAELVTSITDGESDSSSDLSATQMKKLISGMEDKLEQQAENMVG